MATLVNGSGFGTWSSYPKYAHLTGTVTRSGNTVTLSGLTFWMTFQYNSYGSGYSMPIKICDGSSGGAVLSSTGHSWTFNGRESEHISLNNASVNVGTTDTSHTFSLLDDDNVYCAFTVSFPSGYVAPTKPTISATSVNYSNWIDITYGTTSFGVPSSGTVYLYGGTSASPTTQINTKTTTGNTTYTYTGLSYNRKYYFRALAGNGSGYSDYTGDVTATTVPPDLTGMTVNSQTYTAYNRVSVTVTFTKPSDSGALTETLWYKWQVQGTGYGSDINGGTISGTSKQVTITNVPTGSRIAVYAWVKTSAGQNAGKLYYFNSSTTHTAPNFSNFTYEDTNASAIHITGNNQTMIQGISDPKITISTANKATGNDGIAVSNYSFSFSGRSDTATWSSSSAVTKTLGKPTTSGSQIMTVSAVDALSLSKAVNKSVTVYPWSAPTITATATRLNNFENNTTIHIAGTWSPVTISGVNKNTMEVKYRYKQSTTSTWGSWITLTASHDTANWTTQDFVINIDNNYSWNLEAYVGDYFTSNTTSITIPAGQPQFFIGADGRCAVGGKPAQSLETGEKSLLDVKGRIFSNNKPVLSGKVTSEQIDFATFSNGVITSLNTNSTNSGYWRKLGNITFSSHKQGEFTAIRIFVGDGNNGHGNQNAFIDLIGQLGWTGESSGRAGWASILFPLKTTIVASTFQLKIIAKSNANYDIWLKWARTYCVPNVLFFPSVNNTSTWTPDTSGSWTSTEPSGTVCDIVYCIVSSS